MFSRYKKLRLILERQEITRLTVMLFLVCSLVIAEIAGLFSIFPFMKLVANPELIDTNHRFQQVYQLFGFTSKRSMIIWMGFAVLFVYAFTGVFSALTNWIIQKTVWNTGHQLTMRLLHRYTRMPYEFFLTHNSAELVKKVISDIAGLSLGILMAGSMFIKSLFMSLIILGMLLFVNPTLAVLTFTVMGGIYVLMHLGRHKYLEQMGQTRLDALSVRMRTFTEALAGTKTLRVSGATKQFVDRFEEASRIFCNIQPRFKLFNIIPKHVIEVIAFGGIVGIVLYLLINDISLVEVMPTLTLFAMAMYKITPALNRAFAAAANLSHNLPVIDLVYEDLQTNNDLLKPIEQFAQAQPLNIQSGLIIDQVSYRYDATGLPVLNNISLEIPVGSKCALVGSTGCGKSTLIDIMVGLLFPSSGQVRADDTVLSRENIFSWQKSIAYVPQDVFLFDDTIAANIALGQSPDQIDQARLEWAADIAQVNEFLTKEMEKGMDTMVGDGGSRLSGGQRQRIGLARAIYAQPKFLFLDESTSALDSITEEKIVSAIEKELANITVVMIAHRLASVRNCDKIFVIDSGQVADSGSYDQLIASNAKFRSMTEVNG